jgi:predicted DCC family thiol-disulfide oxidoreductase YuxK
VSHKSARIAAMIESFRGRELDAHYLGYFDCFNRRLFYEAHDVLEDLWLADKHGVNGDFYKGLIQLAGAFVHLQKNRLRPAAALFKLARANLEKYPREHERLNLAAVCALIEKWLGDLEHDDFSVNPLTAGNAPRLSPLSAPNAGWVFYDGECQLCINNMRRHEKLLRRHGFEPATLQTPWVRERLGSKPDSELTEMIVLTVEGNRFGGADGIAQIARRIWWAWPLFALAHIPGIHFIFRAIYRRVAASRHCLGGKRGLPVQNKL